MKPAPFEYHAPETVDEVLELLDQHGFDAKILAGGQTLGPLLNMRMAAPEVLIDINRVKALDYQRHEDDGGLTLGALTRQSTLEDDAQMPQRQPLIAAAEPEVAHRAIRNRGTVGGSLAHADPAAEWPGLAVALDAELVLQRHGGASRTIAALDFFEGALATVIEPEEMLTEIRIPPWRNTSGWGFHEFNRRHGDFALAGAMVRLDLAADGGCRGVAIALIGVEDTPIRAGAAEQFLRSQRVDDAALQEAARRAADNVTPMHDIHASADYRRSLTRTLAYRALADAAARATRIPS
ncbi:MAG: FAD binding domain-containing protein [Ottowia sp.]|nr:FAD binding domain-containing protein [Ottowia sp.]